MGGTLRFVYRCRSHLPVVAETTRHALLCEQLYQRILTAFTPPVARDYWLTLEPVLVSLSAGVAFLTDLTSRWLEDVNRRLSLPEQLCTTLGRANSSLVDATNAINIL